MRSGSTPTHDVVVTNPPFSGDHIQRLLEWCTRKMEQQLEQTESGDGEEKKKKKKKKTKKKQKQKHRDKADDQPWFALLPQYIANKPWFHSLCSDLERTAQACSWAGPQVLLGRSQNKK